MHMVAVHLCMIFMGQASSRTMHMVAVSFLIMAIVHILCAPLDNYVYLCTIVLYNDVYPCIFARNVHRTLSAWLCILVYGCHVYLYISIMRFCTINDAYVSYLYMCIIAMYFCVHDCIMRICRHFSYNIGLIFNFKKYWYMTLCSIKMLCLLQTSIDGKVQRGPNSIIMLFVVHKLQYSI